MPRRCAPPARPRLTVSPGAGAPVPPPAATPADVFARDIYERRTVAGTLYVLYGGTSRTPVAEVRIIEGADSEPVQAILRLLLLALAPPTLDLPARPSLALLPPSSRRG